MHIYNTNILLSIDFNIIVKNFVKGIPEKFNTNEYK